VLAICLGIGGLPALPWACLQAVGCCRSGCPSVQHTCGSPGPHGQKSSMQERTFKVQAVLSCDWERSGSSRQGKRILERACLQVPRRLLRCATTSST
jgi:hypothetical protein